jgi:uncharacterized protein (TIRG00374 family)
VDEKVKKQKTVKLPVIISITISIAIIILILFFTVDAKTLDKLAHTPIRYEFFVAAIFLNILYWILWGLRLKILANAIDKNVNVGLWESTKIVIANLFLAGITPSMAGGEPVRIYLLNKDGMNLGGATAAVLGERLLDAVFLLALIPLGIYIFKDKPGIEALNLGLTVGVVVFILFIILFLYAIARPEKTKAFLIYISKKLSRFSKKKDSEIKIISRINHEVDNFSSSMKCFVGERKKALFLAGVVTILFWSTGFMIASMILLGLGLPPFFLESYAAQALLIIIIMLPLTPGSSGIAELGILGLYGVLLTDPAAYSLLGVFTILYRFITFHMNVIAGAIFQYRIFKSITSFSMDMIKTHEEKPERK